MDKKIFLPVVLALIVISMLAIQVRAEDSRIITSFISQTPDPVKPGDYVELRWKIDNSAGKSSDYTFELDYGYPFSLDPDESARKSVGSLTGYQTLTDGAILYWKVRVDSNAIEGDMNKVKLKYWKTSEPGFVISGPDQVIRIRSEQGLVEVGEVGIAPEEVQVGNMFNMAIRVDNKGSGFVDNVKIKVDTKGTGLTPVGTTNQKIIKRIPGTSSENISFRFFVDADAAITVNHIPVDITYYDKFGTEYTTETIVGVPVKAKPAYLTNLETSDVYLSGSKGNIVVSVSNIGKGDLNFVVLEIVETDDYEVIGSKKTYLGNLESDDFETGQFEIYIKPTDKDSVPLKFNLHYRDNYDKVYNDEFVLDNKIYTKDKAREIGLMPTVDYTSYALFCIIVIGIAGGWWYRKRYKKKA